MKIVWLTANRFGYELLREAIRLIPIHTLVILSKNATTRMYDGIERDKWNKISYHHGIRLVETERIDNDAKCLRETSPDYIIVAGWRQIIPQEILDIPKFGVIGFHPTLLPEGRGSAPIINSILFGVKMSGATMFFYNDKVDSGDIVSQRHFYITENDYAIDVYEKYIEASVKLIKKYLPMLGNGELSRRQQDESKATFFPKRTILDNEITLFDSLETIDRKVRAFSEPYLGAFIKKNGKKLIIERCRIENE